MEVDRAVVNRRAGARRFDRADQFALFDVDHADRIGRGRAERNARGGEVLRRPQRETAAPFDHHAASDERLAVGSNSRAENLSVVVRVDRPFVGGAGEVA